MAKLLEMREVLHDESLPWAVTGAPRGPLEALPLALSCSEEPAMQGFGVEPKPRPNGQSVSALVMGIGRPLAPSRNPTEHTTPNFADLVPAAAARLVHQSRDQALVIVAVQALCAIGALVRVNVQRRPLRKCQ